MEYNHHDKPKPKPKPKPKVVVLMVPLPLQGHLNQLLHLSHLITSYAIPVHYAGYLSHNHQAKFRLHGLDPNILTNIHFHDFHFSDDKSSVFKASMLLRSPVSHLIQQLSQNFQRVIVIHDLFMTSVVQDVKIIPNAQAYVFTASSAFVHFLSMWEGLPDNQKPFHLDSNDIPESLPTQEGCGTPDLWDVILYQLQCLGFESGWLYNTSRVIDGKYVGFIEKLTSTERDIKHFAIGPVHPMGIDFTSHKHPCLEWLDEQEKNSVIYVAFGSITSLKNEQIEELANGLIRCGKKFIWVLKKADPNAFTENNEEPKLPEGYETRVKDRGMIVRDWAPQLQILAHSSVGGFMSHCGWNSCIESISQGVPIVAWPMHSEQPRNAILITQVLRIGVLVRDWELRNELVSSTTIEFAVKTLMESKEMQERAIELGEVVRASVEEHGVSYLERDSFISHIST